MKENPDVFGFEVDVKWLDHGYIEVVKTFHFRGKSATKAKWQARRKGIFTPHAFKVEVIDARPLNQEAYERCYGLDQRM
jgi:hypothetical protein